MKSSQVMYLTGIASVIILLISTVDGISHFHLKDYAVNEKSLSITSFAFNPTPNPPEWVSKILGAQAVFFQQISEFGSQYGGIENVKKARQNFQKNNFYPLPNYAYWPECSIELLGYVPLGLEEPFRGRKDRYRAGTGKAKLVVSDGQMQGLEIECYYRALYANWRKEDYNTTFWTVPFYCPGQPKKEFCSRFLSAFSTAAPGKNHEPEVSFRLHMALPWYSVVKGVNVVTTPKSWIANLVVYRDAAHGSSISSSMDRAHYRGHYTVPGYHYAVCTAWVYTTSHPSKELINKAFIYEFLRYYANLGIMVLVYDRAGASMQGLYETDYVKANPQRGMYHDALEKYVVYHNWTVHGLLHGDKEGADIKSDMEGFDERMRQDMRSDKALTYSHCRFEAKENYGITKTIVIDFDEFLFCQGAAVVTPQSQAALIHRYLSHFAEERRDQISFGKTAVVSKAKPGESLKDCANAEIAKNAGLSAHKHDSTSETSAVAGSIFNCFASIDYIDNIQFIKSIHLTHRCPFTSRHAACSPCPHWDWNCTTNTIKYNQYDCLCDSAQYIGKCHFVHLSIIDSTYSTNTENVEFDRDEMLRTPSELMRITNPHGADAQHG